jgi:hypothetical protein
LHLDDISTLERNLEFQACEFLDLLQEFDLNFDLTNWNRITRWIWSLVKALMKVIMEAITRGVTALPL